MLKRVISAAMALIMSISSSELTGLSAIAENNNSPQTNTISCNDLTMETSTPFAALLSNEIEEQRNNEEYNEDSGVMSIDFNDNIAEVKFRSSEDCTIIVGIFTDDKQTLVASGTADVSSVQDTASVTIDTEEMPEYYYAKAFLVDTETLAPISKEYDYTMHTKEMQELLAMTTDDFSPELVLDLDGDKNTNFAIYSEDTVFAESDNSTNTLVSADDESGVYVFDNADDTIKSLQKGDKFSCTSDDGEVVLVIVDNIDVDGNKVTLTSEDTQLEDIFDYVKIEGDGDLSNAEYGDVDWNDEYFEDTPSPLPAPSIFGPSNKQLKLDVDTNLGGRKLKLDLGEIKSKNKGVSLSGELAVGISLNVKLYYTKSYQYVKLSVEAELELSMTAKAQLKNAVPLFTLPVKISPVPGLYCSIDPSLVFSLTGTVTLKGSFSVEVGFEYNSESKLSFIAPTPTNNGLSLSASATLFIGVELAPSVSVVSKKFAEAKMTAQAGVEIKATIEPKYVPDEYHECQLCVAGTAAFKIKLGVSMHFLKIPKLTYEEEWASFTVKAMDFYYSFDHRTGGFSTCPWNKVPYKLTVLDEFGSPIPHAKVVLTRDITIMAKDKSLDIDPDKIVIEKGSFGMPMYYYVETFYAGNDGVLDLPVMQGEYKVEVTSERFEKGEKTIDICPYNKKGSIKLKYKRKEDRDTALSTATTAPAVTIITTTTPVEDTTATATVTTNASRGGVPSNYSEGDILKSKYYSPNWEQAAVKPKLTITVNGAEGGKVFNASDIAGKTIKCTLNVSGAQGNYCSTGIVISYDKRLEIELNSKSKPATAGTAISGLISAAGSVYDLPNGFDGFRTCTAGIDNEGEDGTMWTFNLKVPENAQPEDIFPIDILYCDDTIFASEDRFGPFFHYDNPEEVERFNKINTYTFTQGIYNATYNCNFKANSDDISLCPALASIPGCYDGYIAINGSSTPSTEDEDEIVHLYSAPPTPSPAPNESEINTVSFNDLDPERIYNFYAVSEKRSDIATARFDADSDRLVYISQGVADENGELTFSYALPDGAEVLAEYVVGAKKAITAAEIKLDDIPYDGEEHTVSPVVTYNGVKLTENTDYIVSGNTTAQEAGGYILAVTGIGDYFGTIPVSYTVVCEHIYEDGVCTNCGAHESPNYILGDVNEDGKIDAKDASAILAAYSLMSIGEESGMTSRQYNYSDVNSDEKVDAKDSSVILSYYSFISTTSDEVPSIEDFIKSINAA